MMSLKTNKGFLITGNLLLGSVFFVIVGVFGFNFFGEGQATTTLSIEPQTNGFNVEEDVIIDIFISSRVPINALEASLTFPPDFLEVKELILSSPIIDIWIREPEYSNEEGFVKLTGGTTKLGGVVGKSKIVSIVFTPKKSGKVNLEFTNSLVLQHDGLGSDLNEATTDASLFVSDTEQKQPNVVTRSTTVEYEIKPVGPPSPDLDSDGNVSLNDLSVFLPSLRKSYNKAHDFNQDGKINIKDVSIMMSKVFSN